MNKEDKELLLMDLCARLPYKTKCYNSNTEEIFTLADVSDTDTDYPDFDCGYADIEDVRPYLRPMPSMTEEEKKEFDEITLIHTPWGIQIDRIHKLIDWLNSHHFDFRNLIEKGLALEAPEGMYN